MSTSYALAIDIGGTFTDLVLHDPASGRFFAHKELTTPDAPERGVLSGIRRLLEREGIAPGAVARVVHATTLLTNALIERKGAPTGLLTTAGFRDILEIGHERKYEIYDLFLPLPAPLVRRAWRLEAAERLAPDGRVEIPLDEAAVLDAADRLVAEGVTSLAIGFLHAYANPAHERRAAALIAARHPSLHLSLSSEVSPQIREYDRLSTTCANAYVKPLAVTYLDRLAREIAALGVTAPLFLMLSNGGLTHVEEAKRIPVRLLESGPAAGALAGAVFGARSGAKDLLAFDMGGTTAKLAVVRDGAPRVAHRFEAAREKRFTPGSGLPITISTVELIEIGAGGGSIASLDALGLLKVGPRSAGSAPGPACYGRGGAEPTVTDANLALGALAAEGFAGGTMRLDLGAMDGALARLADAAELPRDELAAGIQAVVNEAMSAAARVHLAEQGGEGLDTALLVTGGGGPLHGPEVARRLGLTRVICPPAAGVASALGLLLAPARVDQVATLARPLDTLPAEELDARFGALEAEARRVIAETLGAHAAVTAERAADLRFAGQGFELVTPLPPGPCDMPAIRAAFEAAYRAVFSGVPPVAVVEVVNIRVAVSAATGDGRLDPGVPSGAPAAPHARRPVRFGDAASEAPVFRRDALTLGQVVAGPAVVEDGMSTLLVPPGARATLEASGNLVLDLPG
ncbi:MAG: hydantoinase/oxoprolinase family protein [Acetobacteraceae bacterium]|nr:hydantoinase/oxoprolinase family protein [Acetobacteraceae bacterium]